MCKCLVNDVQSYRLRGTTVADKASTTFPQILWKSLWKTPLLALQVSEKFRLLAFCTRSRQNIANSFQVALRPSFSGDESTRTDTSVRRLLPRARCSKLVLRQVATPRAGDGDRERATRAERSTASQYQHGDERGTRTTARHRP